MLAKTAIWSSVALCLVASASVAHADEVSPAVAEALFREGQRLFTAGQTTAACDKFSESLRLDPQTGTLLNLALCHEKEGRIATAWSEFGDVVAQAARKGEREREVFARSHLAATEKALSRVTLDIPAGITTIEVDGHALGEAAWSIALPLDPGDHTFTFSAQGKKPRVVRASVPSGPASVRVATVPLEDESGSAAARPFGQAADARPPGGGGSQKDGHEARTIGFVIGGIGIAALATGGVFGAMTLAKKSVVDEHCSGRECDSTGYDAQSTAHTFATVSTVGCAIAAVALGTGAYLVFAPSSSPARRAMRVGPVAVSGGALLQAEGSF